MIKTIKGTFYYSGFEYIYRKIKPAKKPHPLPTLPLWLIGIYVAAFGVASQRYENHVDIIENRANAIFAQLGSSNDEVVIKTLSRITRIQNMDCPYKPNILNPVSIWRSFINNNENYDDIVVLMRETLENWKRHLSGVDLSDAKLQNASFEAEINTHSGNGTIQNSDIANFEKANLYRADLRGADLYNANLRHAFLEGVDLEGADLLQADLFGANLINANLKNTEQLTVKQLSVVETLYNVQNLKPSLLEEIKKDYPHLLKKPNYVE
ncbi:MAG: pentapeptide repeat-containing protein [Candidatus Scalindua sp.]|jgi:hypothetical protein|nr:pentapeptide repeat-containing protein [Candidatus Scalindua sp.]MBT5304484.1 pentapeptide repeat-containing protein [Candidatus Scalindua sp.]MBT6047657.1 pentapeptide repeat-containing protein [Candidatus Scalindua sp.]MBT6226559.1 pentapeptide repeat-containing protein [Candidatus Scalindua sp.]MBT6563781.1 pentapeptide repeat-containing protein [Candidatus Scalindua sp.]